MGPAGQRSAPLQRRHRVDSRGGAPAPARDLHDGIGPALTGVSLGLRTAIRQLGRYPTPEAVAPSRALLERVADEVDSVVVEVKRIVRDLRPTALDQLGLVGAVAEFARTFG